MKKSLPSLGLTRVRVEEARGRNQLLGEAAGLCWAGGGPGLGEKAAGTTVHEPASALH